MMLIYAVRSENASRNLSPLSGRVYVTPMRNVRLIAPQNLTTHYADKRVWMSWDMAEEFDRNVMGYRLERRIAPANKADTSQHFKPVRTDKMLMNYYEDADVKEGVTYEYRLFSQGAHGIESDPSVVSSVNDCCDRYSTAQIETILDAIKQTGFHYATVAGLSVSVWDAAIPKDKPELIDEAQNKVDRINGLYEKGRLSEQKKPLKI